MNNNKLFKLVVVLCVSILIVVSCGKKNFPSGSKLPSSPGTSLPPESSTPETPSPPDSSTPPETPLPPESSTPETPLPPESSTPSELPTVGTLRVNTSSTIMNFHNDENIHKAKSSAITVSGFSDSFRKEVKTKTDVKYVIRKIIVTGVTSKYATVEEVQRSIRDNALEIVYSSSGRFDEIQIVLSGARVKSEKNARDIMAAINTGRSAYVTLLVEAFARGNTAGKFYSSVFEVPFIMQVLI